MIYYNTFLLIFGIFFTISGLINIHNFLVPIESDWLPIYISLLVLGIIIDIYIIYLIASSYKPSLPISIPKIILYFAGFRLVTVGFAIFLISNNIRTPLITPPSFIGSMPGLLIAIIGIGLVIYFLRISKFLHRRGEDEVSEEEPKDE